MKTEFQFNGFDYDRSEASKCLICYDPVCTKACPQNANVGGILRSLYFRNVLGAAKQLTCDCNGCGAPCETACVLDKRKRPVAIRELLLHLRQEAQSLPAHRIEDVDLSTDICGVRLENPFLLSSSVVSSTYDMCARAFEAGWAGAAFKTICSFEIHEASPRFSAISGDNGAILGFKNIEQLSDHSVEENLEIFRRLKKNYPSKCILASIMGRDDREWEELARRCEENGADAVELNFSCPNMADGGLGSDIGQTPELVERFTAAAKRGTRLPVLAKLTPNVASMSPAAEAARRGGADGVCAVNTVKSVVGVDPHTYVSAPAVHGMSAVGGYSGSAIRPIALRFMAELGQNPRLRGMHLSGTGGAETWPDALEFILLGAGTVQITTAVMQYGYRIIDDLKAGLNLYLAEKGADSLEEIRGLALDSVSGTTDGLERDTVVFPRFLREKCIGCGRCVISCADGGHQAIRLNGERRPVFSGKKCVGCHLCVLVCPEKAIRPGRKRIAKPSASAAGEKR